MSYGKLVIVNNEFLVLKWSRECGMTGVLHVVAMGTVGVIVCELCDQFE